MLAWFARMCSISALPVRTADPWRSMFSDEGGVGTLSSFSTRRSRARRAGGTCAGVFFVGRRLLRGFAARDDARRRARAAEGFDLRDRAMEGFDLRDRAAGARRLLVGRLPDLFDPTDFLGLAAALSREGRFRDFF